MPSPGDGPPDRDGPQPVTDAVAGDRNSGTPGPVGTGREAPPASEAPCESRDMSTTIEAPGKAPDPTFPGSGLGMIYDEPEPVDPQAEPRPPREPGRFRRVVRSRSFVLAVALLVVGATLVGALVAVSDLRSENAQLEEEIAALQAGSVADDTFITAAEGRNEALRMRIAKLQARVAALGAQKVETIVETETVTVTETVTEYVPNGEEVVVEITGFEGLIDVYDVQLRHSYGYSDLVGIAENTSGDVISYAQLGCSFLDKDGELLTTSIDNKQSWQPGQSWGFVCSADVDATGGILRVDEMS